MLPSSFLPFFSPHTSPPHRMWQLAMHDDEANAKSLSVPHKSRTAEPTAAATRNTAIPPSTAQTDRHPTFTRGKITAHAFIGSAKIFSFCLVSAYFQVMKMTAMTFTISGGIME